MRPMDVLIVFTSGTTMAARVKGIALGATPDQVTLTLEDGTDKPLIDVRHVFANYIEQGAEDRRNASFGFDCPTCRKERLNKVEAEIARKYFVDHPLPTV